MAEIRVERKRTPAWVWIVLVVLLAVLAWIVYDQFVSPDPVIDEDVVPAEIGMLPPATARR